MLVQLARLILVSATVSFLPGQKINGGKYDLGPFMDRWKALESAITNSHDRANSAKDRKLMDEAARNGKLNAAELGFSDGLTRRKPGLAVKGLDNVNLILINLTLINKSNVGLRDRHQNLNPQELDCLVCDMAIVTMVHEAHHVQDDSGDEATSKDCWELCAYDREWGFLYDMQSHPDYAPGSNKGAALDVERARTQAALNKFQAKCEEG